MYILLTSYVTGQQISLTENPDLFFKLISGRIKILSKNSIKSLSKQQAYVSKC